MPNNIIARKELLKRLNMSILFNFLEFVELLSENPSEWTKKFEDLKRLLFSMHSAINSYRPHQARTLIIAQLQQQISRRKDLLQLIEQYVFLNQLINHNIKFWWI